jgi:TolA-binding protein
VELAYFSQEKPEKPLEDLPEAQVPFTFPLTPNLFDKSRPMFDTQGRALQALKSVWMNDPTGPLADDALMIVATHHLRKGDYAEADHDFGTIREQFGDSEHAEAAYVMGQHASYKSYHGARYDGKQLEESRKLTDSALRLFPSSPHTRKLEGDLARMKEELAERDWQRVEFHMKRGEKDSAAVYSEYILRDYPSSPRASNARNLLLKLGPDYAQGILDVPLHKPPATPVEEYVDPQDNGEEEPQEPGRVHVSEDAEPVPERR